MGFEGLDKYGLFLDFVGFYFFFWILWDFVFFLDFVGFYFSTNMLLLVVDEALHQRSQGHMPFPGAVTGLLGA